MFSAFLRGLREVERAGDDRRTVHTRLAGVISFPDNRGTAARAPEMGFAEWADV